MKTLNKKIILSSVIILFSVGSLSFFNLNLFKKQSKDCFAIADQYTWVNNSGSSYSFNYAMAGGGGGRGGSVFGDNTDPTSGARKSGSFSLANGETLQAYVGGGGGEGQQTSPGGYGGGGGAGYYGGGAGFSYSAYYGGGGGGSSALLINGVAVDVADGGRGGSWNVASASGGTTVGGAGSTSGSFLVGGGGAGSGFEARDLTGGLAFDGIGGSAGTQGASSTFSNQAYNSKHGGGGGFGGSGYGRRSVLGHGARSWLSAKTLPVSAGSVTGVSAPNGGPGNGGLVILCPTVGNNVFFSIPSEVTASLSTVVSSTTITTKGKGTVNISIAGSNSPEISINGGVWVTSGTISAGQTLAARMTSSASYNTVVSATITVGNDETNWSVKTLYNYTMFSGNIASINPAEPNTLYTASSTILVGGSGPSMVSVTATSAGAISINGGAWVTSGTVYPSDQIAIRQHSSLFYNTNNSATVSATNVGQKAWGLTTYTITVPNFTQTDPAELNTNYTSNIVNVTTSATVAGLLNLTGGINSTMSINGGPWVTSGTISNGQTVQLQAYSSTSMRTISTVTLTSNNTLNTWNIMTGLLTFDYFVNEKAASASTVYTSNTLTASGNISSVPIQVSGEGSPLISINGGGWVVSGVISNGQTLSMQLTTNSSGTSFTTASVTGAYKTYYWSVDTQCHKFVTSFLSETVFPLSPVTVTYQMVGGGGGASGIGAGTAASSTTGTFDVNSGDIITVYVGGAGGGGGVLYQGGGGGAGYFGGGGGGLGTRGAGGGGGSSAILLNLALVSAASGGIGANYTGATGGGGGSSTGGIAGTGGSTPASAGTMYNGGNAGRSSTPIVYGGAAASGGTGVGVGGSSGGDGQMYINQTWGGGGGGGYGGGGGVTDSNTYIITTGANTWTNLLVLPSTAGAGGISSQRRGGNAGYVILRYAPVGGVCPF